MIGRLGHFLLEFFGQIWTQGTLRHILGPILVIFEIYMYYFLGGLSVSLHFTLSVPVLQSYVIRHTCMKQKSNIWKMLFLPWLTIVLHRIIKENLHFSPKEARVHYNLSTIMSYPLFVSRSKFICPKNTNRWRIRSNFVLLFRWFKFTLKPPYSIMHDNLQLAIWDTSFWTSLLKFGHKGPWDIS